MSSGKKADDMSFLEHLEALRWHILRSLVVIVLFGIVAFVFKEIVFQKIMLAHLNPQFLSYQALCWISDKMNLGNMLCINSFPFELINTEMAGQFMAHIKVSFTLGFVVAFPYVFWEFWRFIRPGLYENEAHKTRGLVAICTLLFLTGVAFGYFCIAPFSINFLGAYQVDEMVQNRIHLGSFLTIVTMVSIASGIIFELPVVVYFLSKLGILTPDIMRQYRRHAFVIILILSAVITPPDVTSQLIICIPVLVLYEISIGISKRAYAQYEQELR